MDEEYYDRLGDAGKRYQQMIVTRSHLLGHVPEDLVDVSKFVEEYIQGCSDKLPLCKLNRWLGYIQGRMIASGLTTVQAERDITRPWFGPLDYPETEF